MAAREIEGSPYSATLIPMPYLGDGSSLAYGIVRPPFQGSDAIIDEVMWPGIEVSDYATTQSAKVLSLSIEGSDEPPDHTTEGRLELAFDGLSSLVKQLNEIENDTFKSEYR